MSAYHRTMRAQEQALSAINGAAQKAEEEMTRPDIEAIKARYEAATPGPWGHQPWSTYALPSGDYAESVLLANAADDGEIVRGLRDEDGEFIAAARSDVPDLIAYIERLETRVGRLSNLERRNAKQRDQKQDRINAARKLHGHAGYLYGVPQCACTRAYPCDTRQALEGETK